MTTLSETTLFENPIEADMSHAALYEIGAVQLNANYNQLFTVEEAFVRLGQSRQNGELLVLNKEESIHIFVEDGFIVKALAKSEEGEAAVILALNLPAANFVWAAEVKPRHRDLKIDIRQYVLSHSLSRDLQIAQSIETQKRETLALPKTDSRRKPPAEKQKGPGYYFDLEAAPGTKIPLKKSVTILGREIYCDWVIDDIRVSRKHCVLQVATRGLLVRNLEATNGTFINGKLVMDGYLKPGDRLSLGGYIMTLRADPLVGTSIPAPKAK